MINTAFLATQIRNLGLDAEGSNYYDDKRDIEPAINASINWVVAVATMAFGDKKYTDEAFKELKSSRVYLTNSLSRIKISEDIWSIRSVHPLPELADSTIAVVNPADPFESKAQVAMIHKSSNGSAKRLTIEEWDENKQNPFQPSNVYQTTKCTEDKYDFGYLDSESYTVPTDQAGNYKWMIEIRPYIPDRLVTLFVLDKPPVVEYTTAYAPTTLPFDIKLQNLLIDKAINFIARRQGDNTTTYTVTQNDIATLIAALQ